MFAIFAIDDDDGQFDKNVPRFDHLPLLHGALLYCVVEWSNSS